MATTTTIGDGAAVADMLAAHGCPLVCGMPGGGTNLDVIDALGERGIPFQLMQTESASIMLAGTLSDLTGNIAVAVTTLGPGVANAVNGVANAWLDRLPVLYISDSYGDEITSFATRQLLDHCALLAPVVKGSLRPAPGDFADATEAAIRLANAPVRGPVHIDMASSAAGGGAVPDVPGPAEDLSQLPAALELLEHARRPIILAGCEVRLQADGDALRALASALGAPVLTSYRGKGAVAEDDPLSGGLFTNAVIERELVTRADLIIAVGLDPVEHLPRPWPYETPVIALRESAAPDAHVRPTATVVGALREQLDALRAAVSGQGALQDEGQVFASSVRERLAVALRGTGAGLSPAEVVQIADAVAPSTALATADSGAHMFATSYFWTTRAPRGYLCSSGLATMGFALPGAIAASIAHPDRPVMAFTGDGGFLMNLADLATAAQRRSKIVCVVFDDRCLSLIELKQRERGLGGDYLDLPAMDLLKTAEGLGVAAFQAETTAEYERTLTAALALDGPSVISVRTDPTGYGTASKLLRG